MNASRRGILRFGVQAATLAATHWSLIEVSNASTFGAFGYRHDDGFIRLNSNENAYGPSVKVVETIKSAIGSANRYPRMEYDTLVEHIANSNHVTPEQVLVGCGSTEVLRVAACAFLGNGKHLIQASPTFEAIEHYARAVGSDVKSIRLTRTFTYDLDAMLACAGPSTGLVYICNPHNPTGSVTPRKDLEGFIGKLPASPLVVIDEAYHHYASGFGTYASFIDRPLDDERVIVTRTFSKIYGLAGLRLGYAVGSPKVIQRMRKFATENNVNALVTRAAMAALDDTEGVNDFIHRNADDRQEFLNQAVARGLRPIDSHANFIMMNTFHPAEELIRHFHNWGILIGHTFAPLDTFIRISLGRPEEMQAFWKTWDLLPYPKHSMHH